MTMTEHHRRSSCVLALIALAVSVSWCAKAVQAPATPATAVQPRPRSILPRSFEVGFLWQPAAGVTMPRNLRLRVDAAGRPVLLHGASFLPLATERGAPAPPPFGIAAMSPPDDAIWTDDGAMLFIHGRQLSVATPSGLRAIRRLPAPGMRLAPAGRGKCWVFGGAGAFAPRLFLYDAAGTVVPYFDAPGPITAVSGTLESVHVAAQGVVLRLSPTAGIFALYQGAEPVHALAAAPGVGVLFSTTRGVFFLGEDGSSVRIGDQRAAELHVRGQDLFVLYEGVGILRGRPLSSFREGSGG